MDVLVGVALVPRLMRTNDPEVVGVVSDSSIGDTTVASWVAAGGRSGRVKRYLVQTNLDVYSLEQQRCVVVGSIVLRELVQRCSESMDMPLESQD